MYDLGKLTSVTDIQGRIIITYGSPKQVYFLDTDVDANWGHKALYLTTDDEGNLFNMFEHHWPPADDIMDNSTQLYPHTHEEG